MSFSRRQSLRFRIDSLDACERRVLLSGMVAVQPHHIAAAHATPRITPVSSTLSSAPGQAHTFLYRFEAGSRAHHRASGHAAAWARGALGVQPFATSPPGGALQPWQVRRLYHLDQISNLGQGQTIAIVDAYHDPNIFNDADVFDKAMPVSVGSGTSYYTGYGAASTWLTQASPSGVTPPANTGWAQEISLDVEWAHAIAPRAKILLVEAASSSFNDLLAAESYAVSHGAKVISNSWGSGEFSTETGLDSHFSTPGVTYVFSAGDSGNQSYPAESRYVVSVGGTHVTHDSNYYWTSESGWSSGGGGVSAYESKPSYQGSLSYSKRANPDIAYDADPYTGFAVYDSYGGYNWQQFGGTSAGAPQWAAIIALANQGRAAAGKSALDGFTQTLPTIYRMSTGTTGTETLNDVTTGKNAVGSAGVGYDVVTGRGTPRRSDKVVQALVNA